MISRNPFRSLEYVAGGLIVPLTTKHWVLSLWISSLMKITRIMLSISRRNVPAGKRTWDTSELIEYAMDKAKRITEKIIVVWNIPERHVNFLFFSIFNKKQSTTL